MALNVTDLGSAITKLMGSLRPHGGVIVCRLDDDMTMKSGLDEPTGEELNNDRRDQRKATHGPVDADNRRKRGST